MGGVGESAHLRLLQLAPLEVFAVRPEYSNFVVGGWEAVDYKDASDDVSEPN
jgi:hypothetical protein